MVDKNEISAERTVKLLNEALYLLKARTASEEEAKLIKLLLFHIKT